MSITVDVCPTHTIRFRHTVGCIQHTDGRVQHSRSPRGTVSGHSASSPPSKKHCPHTSRHLSTLDEVCSPQLMCVQHTGWVSSTLLDVSNTTDECVQHSRAQGLSLVLENHPPVYRGTSLTRTPPPLGPYHRPRPRVLGGSQGDGRFLMCKVPL